MCYQFLCNIPVFHYSNLQWTRLHRVRCSFSFGYLPESLATILAICARSLLSSSCRAVVRFSAVTPGFLSPSILLPSRRKLGTDEFLWSTRRGVGRHSCFRGRASLLKTEERVINYWAVTFNYYQTSQGSVQDFEVCCMSCDASLSLHLLLENALLNNYQFISGTAQSNSTAINYIFVKFIIVFTTTYGCKYLP